VIKLGLIDKFRKSIFEVYIKSLLQIMPKKVSLSILLMVLISFTEGIGLILLVPLLQLVGLDVQQGSLAQIEILMSNFFSYFGIETSLLIILGIYTIVMSANALLYRWQSIKTYEIQYDFTKHLRKNLYSSICNTKWLFFKNKRSSDFAHALTYEIERIGTGTNQFLSLVASTLVLLVYIGFALQLSGFVTGLIIIVGIVILLLLINKTRSASYTGQSISETSKNMYSATLQHLDGMKTIKSYNMVETNIQEFSQLTENVARSYNDTIKNYSDVKFLFDVSSVVILSIVVFSLVTFLNMSTAELLLLLFLFFRIIPRFSIIQRNYQYFINMLPAFSTVLELEKEINLAAESKKLSKEEIQFNNSIRFENVQFSYQNEKKHSFSINNLNLQIKARKTTAIIGQSGAGKSTTLDMLMGLIQPDEGHILIDEQYLNQKNAHKWRDQIGYVSQETFLFNDTIKANLKVSNKNASDQNLWDALKLAAADGFVSRLPEQLNTIIGDRGVRLSGGEKQRIAPIKTAFPFDTGRGHQ